MTWSEQEKELFRREDAPTASLMPRSRHGCLGRYSLSRFCLCTESGEVNVDKQI